MTPKPNSTNNTRDVINSMQSLKVINKKLNDALNEYSLKRKIQLRAISKHSCPECGAAPISEEGSHSEKCSFRHAFVETISISEENQELLSKLISNL